MAARAKAKTAGSPRVELAGDALLERAGKSRPFAARFEELTERGQKRVPVQLGLVTAAAQPFVTALCARAHGGRTWVVTRDLRMQENVFNDLATWLGAGNLRFFPQLEAPAFGEMLPDPELVSERLAVLHGLDAAGGNEILVLIADSLAEDVPAPGSWATAQMDLRKGGVADPMALAAQLESSGYERVPVVNERGQFAVRGGILDAFSWQSAAPVRVEFFDRDIESIRTFDVNQQTSVESLAATTILLSRPGEAKKWATVADYIGKDDLVVVLEPEADAALPRFASGSVVSVSAGFGAEKSVEALGEDTACLESPLGSFHAGDFVLQEARRAALARQLDDWQGAGWQVAMFFHNEGEIERFREIFPEMHGLEAIVGTLNHGFTIPAAKLAVLTDAEVFGRYQHARARRLFGQERRELGRRRLTDLKEIEEGDLVVHHDYGVARYRGLMLPQGAEGDEVLVLEFAEKARLFVDLDQAHLVSRYVGTGKKSPDLSKLGDEKWSKTRKAAEKGVFAYAQDLLKVQAQRETRAAQPHPADSKWQWEFENSFVFKETPDQLRAIADSKADMESDRPMDRLICGDVGFGKTEVAIRAAFKCVMGGRQVAFLAPTTVLAEQHWRTLRERMSDYPVRVDLLCRWRTAREQKETLKGLMDGSTDIVVGTHRLLSKDVTYKDLGLVIVDEEQRFGVAHKEKFKKLFSLVDVLTLSATPIPRTLYMALMGARDMSTIDTPPPNRVPVQTHLCPYDERIIREAIQRELKRGGQVYFLHNRVGDIEKIAGRVRELVPGAKVDIGHGQMHEDDLEDAMKRFVEGQTDVFVCTTIIESGIDIPNANTIIIDRADRFGLADLYQLRGRVGRAGHQAYAYLMLPREFLATGEAKKRINAIKQYSSLGAGLKIAMRDLEIRGAGNLLGTQQSGHIFNIGFDLYCQMLKRAVARVKGTDPGLRVEVAFRCDMLVSSEAEWRQKQAEGGADLLPAFIPQDYIEESRLRIAAYKELAELARAKDLAGLRKIWRDRFGPLPEPVENLLRVAEMKLSAAGSNIESIEIKENKVMLTRRGEFITISGKFPRVPADEPVGERFDIALGLVKRL